MCDLFTVMVEYAGRCGIEMLERGGVADIGDVKGQIHLFVIVWVYGVKPKTIPKPHSNKNLKGYLCKQRTHKRRKIGDSVLLDSSSTAV